MSRTRGRVTLPVQSIFSEDAKTFTERWGADVLRLDGNKTPDEHSKSLDVKICTTYTPVKGDNDFAMEHMDEQLIFWTDFTVNNSLPIISTIRRDGGKSSTAQPARPFLPTNGNTTAYMTI